MNEVITLPYKPRKLQKVIHDKLKRFNVIVCHRRFGKTIFAVNELIKDALTYPHKRTQVAYIAPTFSQAKKIAWEYAKEYSITIPNIKYNESELRIDFPNGAKMYLLSADNPDSVRGMYFMSVVLDEYAQISPRMWGQVIRPALSDHKGNAIFIGTPQGYNNFYDIYTLGQSLDDWHTALYKASDTGIVDKEELEAAKREMSEAEYAQEYECSFEAAIKGAYYAKEISSIDANNQITKVPYDKTLMVHTAWDLGISDSMTIWFFQWAGQELHVIDYYENTGEGLAFYIKYLQTLSYTYGSHIAPHDIRVRELGTGKSRKEVARELGIDFEIAPQLTIADGIEAVRNLIPKCWFDAENTKDGVDALRQYRSEYSDKRGVFSDNPRHDWTSHAADSFRYFAISKITKNRKSKSWDRKLDYQPIGIPVRRR